MMLQHLHLMVYELDEEKNDTVLTPSIKPSDIIEKSNATSADWLTRDLVEKIQKQEKSEEEKKNS